MHELIPIFCIRLDNYVAPNGNQYTDRDYPALEDAVSPQSKNKRKKKKAGALAAGEDDDGEEVA